MSVGYFSFNNVLKQGVYVGLGIATNTALYHYNKNLNNYDWSVAAICGGVTYFIGGVLAYASSTPLSAMYIATMSYGLVAEAFPHHNVTLPIPMSIGQGVSTVMTPIVYIIQLSETAKYPFATNIFSCYLTAALSAPVPLTLANIANTINQISDDNDNANTNALIASITPIFLTLFAYIFSIGIAQKFDTNPQQYAEGLGQVLQHLAAPLVGELEGGEA